MSAPSFRCLVLGRDPSGESHLLLTLLEPAEGVGGSKRAAEKVAAQAMLAREGVGSGNQDG